MILQTRDREILTNLSRYGILSSAQIGELFFKSVRHTTMMKRLRILEQEKLILRTRGLPGSMSACYLSSHGAREIGTSESPRYTNQNIILHEVSLSEARLLFESMGLAKDFTSESELRRRYQWNRNDEAHVTRLIPDGIFVGAKNDKSYVVALELELQPKNHARLRKFFEEYANKSSIHRVLYLVESSSIGNLVINEWNKCRRFEGSPSLSVCLFEELEKNRSNVLLHDSNGKVLFWHFPNQYP